MERAELYKTIRKSREFERETEKADNSNKEHEKWKNNESSTKQVAGIIGHLKEEIKYKKRTLGEAMTRDTQRQWRRLHRNKKKIRKSNRNKSINTETKEEQSINSNKEQEQKQEKDKRDKK